MGRSLSVLCSTAATLARPWAGARVARLGPRPAVPLELYEFEACPFCRNVREAIAALDLPVRIFPCPRRGPRFREEVVRRGGKAQFPYLVDPNTGKEMYESADIVRYLFERYGRGPVPPGLGAHPLTRTATRLSLAIASLPRLGRGRDHRSAIAPERPLELYAFEACPFCRLVREVLCELELPYLLHSVAKGSPRRAELVERSGKLLVPYLVDPNRGVEMFESDDIVRYLDVTYAREPRQGHI